MQSYFQKMQTGLQTVNSDQTALLRAVRSRSILFAQPYLSCYTYSGTSVAQTLMTRLPQLFRTPFLSPWEKIPLLQILDKLRVIFSFILKMVCCV